MIITITEPDHRLMRETTDSSNSLVERAASTGGEDELIAMVQPIKAIVCTKNAKYVLLAIPKTMRTFD